MVNTANLFTVKKFFLSTGSSVFEVLPITFYSIGQKNIEGLQSWLNLFKKHGLMDYIKNLELTAKYTTRLKGFSP